MEIKHITQNKADFLDLLLLADENETMIARYLDRGEMFAYRYGADIEYPVCLVGAIFRNHEAEESGSIGGRARVVVREISKEFLRVLFSNRSYRRAVSLLRRWGADNCR